MNYELFRTYQPSDLDDQLHLFDRAAVLSTVYWSEFFRELRSIKYDTVIECGVGGGKSLIQILSCLMVERNEYERDPVQVYALDSFEGFPEPSKFDRSPRNSQKGIGPIRQAEDTNTRKSFLGLYCKELGSPGQRISKSSKDSFHKPVQ